LGAYTIVNGRWLVSITGGKIDMLNLVTYLTQTPIFEWYVVRCGFKNIYHKYM
jgi:hypothetical protein